MGMLYSWMDGWMDGWIIISKSIHWSKSWACYNPPWMDAYSFPNQSIDPNLAFCSALKEWLNPKSVVFRNFFSFVCTKRNTCSRVLVTYHQDKIWTLLFYPSCFCLLFCWNSTCNYIIGFRNVRMMLRFSFVCCSDFHRYDDDEFM